MSRNNQEPQDEMNLPDQSLPRPPSPSFSVGSIEAGPLPTVSDDKIRAALLAPAVNPLLENLLCYVVRGQQVEANALLMQDPQLLLGRCDVTDYSGRSFSGISAYEYAYWAMDYNMLRILDTHIMALTPSDMQAAKHEVNWRIACIYEDGLTYMQNGERKCSKNFDLLHLIRAYEKFIQQGWGNIQAWLDVGIAQRDLPAHVANEYCREMPLCDSSFNGEQLPANCIFAVSGNVTETWFPLEVSPSSRLGVNYAFLRGDSANAVAVECPQGTTMYGSCVIDFNSVLSLQKARNNQLKNWRTTFFPPRTEFRFESLLNEARPLSRLTQLLDFNEIASLGMAQSKSELRSHSPLRATHFLGLVVRSMLDEANDLLTHHPEVLLKRGEVTDYSGRLFQDISAFEIAYWVKDIRMLRMLNTYVKTKAQKEEIFGRLRNMEENGLDYKQYGRVYKSKQFDFSRLTVQLQCISVNAENWRLSDQLESMREAWIDLGNEQRELPAHAALEYCFERNRVLAHSRLKVFSTPFFNDDMRKLKKIAHGEYKWFPLDKTFDVIPYLSPEPEGLGEAFAFSASNWPACVSVYTPQEGIYSAHKDYKAIVRLAELRRLQCQLFKNSLKSPDSLLSDSIRELLGSADVRSQVDPSTQSDADLSTFLLHVVQGKQSNAETLLKKKPQLLLMRGDVTDYSGRSFKQISAYQYAYWAKDIDMLKMLSTYITDEKARALILQFVLGIEEDGLTYDQVGVTKTSKHFDVSGLIEALRYFDREAESFQEIESLVGIDEDGNPTSVLFVRFSEDGSSRQLRPEELAAVQHSLGAAYLRIGIMQRDLPVCWVNQYYCRPDIDLNPTSGFSEPLLNRSVTIREPSGDTRPWFPLGELGQNYSLLRGRHNNELNSHLFLSPDRSRQEAFDDQLALGYLDETTSASLNELLENLLSQEPQQSKRPGF